MTRRQKRWSGRLRTTGALLLLFGGVALADWLVGLIGLSRQEVVMPTPAVSPHAPLWAAVAALSVGSAAFYLGRLWSRR